MFHKNKGLIGQEVPVWVDHPFIYDISDKCDLYVMDAKDLGYDTPEKREQFKQRIIDARKQPIWDLNDSNCAYFVNKVTEDQLVRVERPKDNKIANFDFPLMIGASLDEKCQNGKAFALTPDAIQHHGLALFLQHEKNRTLANQANPQGRLGAKLQESENVVTNKKKPTLQGGIPLIDTVDDDIKVYQIKQNDGQHT